VVPLSLFKGHYFRFNCRNIQIISSQFYVVDAIVLSLLMQFINLSLAKRSVVNILLWRRSMSCESVMTWPKYILSSTGDNRHPCRTPWIFNYFLASGSGNNLHSDRSASRERSPDACRMRSWIGFRAGLDVVAKKTILILTRNRTVYYDVASLHVLLHKESWRLLTGKS
jgi:hypothetical protein